MAVIHWTKISGNSGTKSNGTESFWKLVSKSSRKSEYSENPVPFDNFCPGPVTPDPEIDKVQHAGNSSCSTVSASVLVLSSCG